MIRYTLLFALATVAFGCAMKETEYADYGETQKMTDTETVSIGDVLKNTDRYEGKYVRTSGEIVSASGLP